MRKTIFSLFTLFSIHLAAENYYAQWKQDKYINEEFFRGMKGGVFVDVGAHNGISYSNTFFFEQQLGWTGLAVEPIPEVFAQLKENRKCKCIQGCVADSAKDALFFRAATQAVSTEMLSGLVKTYDPVHYQRLVNEVNQTKGQLQVLTVNCFKLNDLMKYNGIEHVNFLSIDTEGGEFEILESIDFDKFKIDVVAVEDNYFDTRFTPFMEKKGYKLHKRIETDLIFVHKDFQPKEPTAADA